MEYTGIPHTHTEIPLPMTPIYNEYSVVLCMLLSTNYIQSLTLYILSRATRPLTTYRSLQGVFTWSSEPLPPGPLARHILKHTIIRLDRLELVHHCSTRHLSLIRITNRSLVLSVLTLCKKATCRRKEGPLGFPDLLVTQEQQRVDKILGYTYQNHAPTLWKDTGPGTIRKQALALLEKIVNIGTAQLPTLCIKRGTFGCNNMSLDTYTFIYNNDIITIYPTTPS